MDKEMIDLRDEARKNMYMLVARVTSDVDEHYSSEEKMLPAVLDYLKAAEFLDGDSDEDPDWDDIEDGLYDELEPDVYDISFDTKDTTGACYKATAINWDWLRSVVEGGDFDVITIRKES